MLLGGRGAGSAVQQPHKAHQKAQQFSAGFFSLLCFVLLNYFGCCNCLSPVLITIMCAAGSSRLQSHLSASLSISLSLSLSLSRSLARLLTHTRAQMMQSDQIPAKQKQHRHWSAVDSRQAAHTHTHTHTLSLSLPLPLSLPLSL